MLQSCGQCCDFAVGVVELRRYCSLCCGAVVRVAVRVAVLRSVLQSVLRCCGQCCDSVLRRCIKGRWCGVPVGGAVGADVLASNSHHRGGGLVVKSAVWSVVQCGGLIGGPVGSPRSGSSLWSGLWLQKSGRLSGRTESSPTSWPGDSVSTVAV